MRPGRKSDYSPTGVNVPAFALNSALWKPATTRETRHLILIQPKLNYEVLEPGARASDAIRQAARDLQLMPEDGVTVRLTGPVPLADEEFSTLA